MLFFFLWNVVHTTAALRDKMCVLVCLVWVCMPGGNCSMSGMLLGSWEGNPEDNGSMWKTLTCFACSLHCLIRLRTTAFMCGPCGQVGTSRALKKDANSPDTAGILKRPHILREARDGDVTENRKQCSHLLSQLFFYSAVLTDRSGCFAPLCIAPWDCHDAPHPPPWENAGHIRIDEQVIFFC